MPVAAAAVAYCLVSSTLGEWIVPFVTQQADAQPRLRNVVGAVPDYILGAVVSVAIAFSVDRRMWGVLAVAAVLVVLAYRAYVRDLDRREHERRQGDVIEFLDQGICVVDSEGRVILWNDALQHMVECPRERALGRSLDAA